MVADVGFFLVVHRQCTENGSYPQTLVSSCDYLDNLDPSGAAAQSQPVATETALKKRSVQKSKKGF